MPVTTRLSISAAAFPWEAESNASDMSDPLAVSCICRDYESLQGEGPVESTFVVWRCMQSASCAISPTNSGWRLTRWPIAIAMTIRRESENIVVVAVHRSSSGRLGTRCDRSKKPNLVISMFVDYDEARTAGEGRWEGMCRAPALLVCAPHPRSSTARNTELFQAPGHSPPSLHGGNQLHLPIQRASN
jgi:hypothetical protein